MNGSNINKKTTKISKAIGMLSLAIIATIGVQNQAFADSANRVTKEQVISFNQGKLMEVGSPSKNGFNNAPLKGFANDLPLLNVMKQITPNGWIVKKHDSEGSRLDTNKLVSWEGGKNWLETLTDISQNYGVDVVVDWTEKTIILSNAKEYAPGKVKNTPVMGKPRQSVFELEDLQDVAVGMSEQGSFNNMRHQGFNGGWQLVPGKTLKENLEVWAQRAGYRLVWLADDYKIDESRGFQGEFDSDLGPVRQLSIDYGVNSRVENPLSFQFFQNRTLVVENVSYEQVGFPQINKPNMNK